MTEITWEVRTMIVPDPLVATVQGLTSTWSAGQGMFLTGCCAENDDEQAVTHRISSGPIDRDIAILMPWTDYEGEEPVSHPGDLEALAALFGGAVTAVELEAIISQCDISTQEPYAAAARLGLRILA